MSNKLSPRPAALAGLLLLCPSLMGGTLARVDFNQRLLATHNEVRSVAGVAPLVWDETLAKDAKTWAQELAATGTFEHSPDDPAKEPEGENLWAGTPDAFSPEGMIRYWANEQKDYRPGIFPDNSRSGNIENVGHYTQLIWRRTGRVGCAIARGQGEEVLVCRYSEAGNVYGERPV